MTGPAVRGSFKTAVDVVRAAADQFPDHLAYVDGDEQLTFAGWDRAADSFAGYLDGLGVGKGDIVCLMLPTSTDYAVCYQGAMRLGAVTTGVNLRLGPTEIDSIVARTTPRVTVYDTGVTPHPGAGHAIFRTGLAEAFAAEPASSLPSLDPADVVSVVWTSGTTGIPKGAVFDHVRLGAIAEAIGHDLISAPFDRRLSPIPFAHVGYMTRIWDEAWNVITSVIVPTPWTAKWALDIIERQRVTVGQGAPTQWRLMLNHEDFEVTDLSSLRVAAIGASNVPPELVREIHDRIGCPAMVRFTSTETGIGTSTQLDDPPEIIATTVGVANPGVEVQVVDDKHHPLPAGAIGTVRLRSGGVMREYWQDPELTASVLGSDGWADTGDLGRLDEQGYLRIVGRRKEMYIRGGYNVYPAEVEGVLNDHPAIVQSGVVGIPDPVLGEIGVAFVTTAPDVSISLDEARSWVRRSIANYKAPDRLVRLDTMPVTAMNKIDKQTLGELATRSLERG